MKKYLDIPYAALSSAQKLDIYLPEEGRGPFPVIVAIHGGAWMFGDKGDTIFPLAEGVTRGYAMVSINYRLSGEAIFPAQIHDVKAAIRWVRAHADEYGFDPAWIAAWGDSAGGHLASLAGVSAGVKALEDLSLGNPEQSCALQAVIDWYGPTDFLKMDEQLEASGLWPADHSEARSPESRLLGAPITAIPERVKAANPETYVTSEAPPFFIQHGTRDHIVPVQQSINLAARLKHVTLDLLEGADHAGPEFTTPENIRKVLKILERMKDEK